MCSKLQYNLYNIIQSVCLLLLILFIVNTKTMTRIYAKLSGILKNDPESVLRGLKLPVVVLSGRYRDISCFSFAADGHLLISLSLLVLPRLLLTQNAFAKMPIMAHHSREAHLIIMKLGQCFCPHKSPKLTELLSFCP